MSHGHPTSRHVSIAGRRLEWLVVIHAGIAVVAVSWMFGGSVWWAKLPLSLWGTLGAVLTAWAVVRRHRLDPREGRRLLWWLLPFAVLVAQVMISLGNPHYQRVQFFEEEVFRPVQANAWIPGSARPDLAWGELWLLGGLYLTGFNLAAAVTRRRLLRGLGIVLVANALVLSVLGTVQKLTGAQGVFFGLVEIPRAVWFSTFAYHNHWGPFVLLCTAAALGLVFRSLGGSQQRPFWNSPAPTVLVTILFMAATTPLSTSRSTTILMGMLLAGAWLHGLFLIRSRRSPENPVGPLVGRLLLVAILGAGAIYWLGRETIERRLAVTGEQIAEARQLGAGNARLILYQDTWQMARDQPWFGWGLESYATVFQRYNSRPISPVDGLPQYYEQAHSDWLQLLAELGITGTVCVILMAVLPLLSGGRRLWQSTYSRYLTVAVLLIAAYAWVEFPFACPAVVLAWWIGLFIAVCHARLAPKDSGRHHHPVDSSA